MVKCKWLQELFFYYLNGRYVLDHKISSNKKKYIKGQINKIDFRLKIKISRWNKFCKVEQTKIKGFLMFLGCIERDQWYNMG